MKRFIFILIKLLFIPLIIRSNTLPFENSNYFESGNLKIHYRVWQPKDAKVIGKVFLLHGFCGSTYSWRKNIDALTEKGNLVVAVDLPPFGYSEKEVDFDYSFDEISEMFWALLNEKDCELDNYDSWDLVGHSLGAEIVSRMVLQNEERVSSLTIVDGLVGHRLSAFSKFLINQSLIRSVIKFSLRNYFIKSDYVEKVLTSAYGRNPENEELNNYLNPLLQENFISSVLNFTRQYKNEIDFSEINIPVLLLWGENDKWITLDEAKELRDKLPNSTLIIFQNTYHCPMETDAMQFNASLISFLQNNEKRIKNFVRK